MSVLDLDANKLFDFSTDHATFTYEDACRAFGWPRTYFYKVVRRLRRILGEDEITLTCKTQGPYEPWLYSLVATIEGHEFWIGNRIKDAETRFLTMESTMRSIVGATDGRSMEGRKARRIEMSLRHLREELALLEVA